MKKECVGTAAGNMVPTSAKKKWTLPVIATLAMGSKQSRVLAGFAALTLVFAGCSMSQEGASPPSHAVLQKHHSQPHEETAADFRGLPPCKRYARQLALVRREINQRRYDDAIRDARDPIANWGEDCSDESQFQHNMNWIVYEESVAWDKKGDHKDAVRIRQSIGERINHCKAVSSDCPPVEPYDSLDPSNKNGLLTH